MLRLKFEAQSLVKLFAGEIARVERGVQAAVERTTSQLQAGLRADTVQAGLGAGNANAWRKRVFPERGKASARAAGLVYSRSPLVIDAFDRGALIRPRGGKHLAIPTGYNKRGGRRGSRVERKAGGRNYWKSVRVTPEQMVRSRQAFVLDARNGTKLWCLKVATAQRRTGKRGTIRNLAFAGGLNVQVGTSRRGAKAGELLRQGFVPMFVLLPAVKLAKRLDLQRRADEAATALAGNIAAALR